MGEEPEIVVEPRRVKRSKPRRRGRVWLFRAIVALVAVGLMPIGLTLVYAVPQVRPVSTLMMLDLVTLRGYDRRWVALEDMGPNIVHAVMMSEDGQFCRHRGVDVGEFRALLEEAGMADHEFELISIDDAWQAATCDSVAAQIRDAGINIRRTILPGATFWNDWLKYPFSSTEWNMRPLGVQVLNLAYRSGVAWNETAFANAEFDSLLDQANGIADADERREVMRRLQEIMQEEGVLIQPYWRSLFRHARPNVHGAEMHPTFEVRYQNYWKS